MRIAFPTPRPGRGVATAALVAALGLGHAAAQSNPAAKTAPAPPAKPVMTAPASAAPVTAAPAAPVVSVEAAPAATSPVAAAPATSSPIAAAPAAPTKPAEALIASPVESPATSHSGIERRAATDEARQYCLNIRDAAADARLAWQAETLRELEKQLADRVEALEAKRAEYEAWLRKREDFLQRAREDIVAIYARMRPDAAAGQLATMDEDTATAVLAKLNARTAGAILNEMEPARAAQLANRLAGVSGLSMKGDKL